MSEALLLVAEGYEQIAAGIRKMVAAQKDTPKKEEKPVKKAEKKETPVADTGQSGKQRFLHDAVRGCADIPDWIQGS